MANDKALISRAQSGDEQAFADLMRANYAFVYAIVIEVVNNPHDVEEVVQDTFLNAYRGLAQYEEQTKFRSWLATIARNRALNWLREQKMDTVSINEVEEHTLQTPNTIDDQLIRDEQRELIRRAMETLSQKDKEIACSYYLDGASYDELTKTHGLSYKAIAFRLSRTRQRLAKRLQYLLTGLSVPPATTLKQIYSGGLTAMKIGTAPKITAGIIGIIALIFIGFIGVRQMTAPNVQQRVYLVPEKEEIAPTPNKTERLVAQTDATPDTEIRENQPQITADEMDSIEDLLAQLTEEQIEDFLAQFEGGDAQSIETESQQDADENVSTEANTSSAEDVMNAYVEAYKNLDFEVILPLLTGAAREDVESILRTFNGELPKEVTNIVDSLPEEMANEMFPRIVEGMQSTLKQMYSQTEFMGGEYVDHEFHFQLKMRIPELPEMPEFLKRQIPELPESAVSLVKMQKVDGAWQIYEN